MSKFKIQVWRGNIGRASDSVNGGDFRAEEQWNSLQAAVEDSNIREGHGPRNVDTGGSVWDDILTIHWGGDYSSDVVQVSVCRPRGGWKDGDRERLLELRNDFVKQANEYIK